MHVKMECICDQEVSTFLYSIERTHKYAAAFAFHIKEDCIREKTINGLYLSFAYYSDTRASTPHLVLHSPTH